MSMPEPGQAWKMTTVEPWQHLGARLSGTMAFALVVSCVVCGPSDVRLQALVTTCTRELSVWRGDAVAFTRQFQLVAPAPKRDVALSTPSGHT